MLGISTIQIAEIERLQSLAKVSMVLAYEQQRIYSTTVCT